MVSTITTHADPAPSNTTGSLAQEAEPHCCPRTVFIQVASRKVARVIDRNPQGTAKIQYI